MVLDGFGASTSKFCSFQPYRLHLSLLDWIMVQSWRVVYLGNMGSKLGRVYSTYFSSNSEDPWTWHVEKHGVWTWGYFKMFFFFFLWKRWWSTMGFWVPMGTLFSDKPMVLSSPDFLTKDSPFLGPWSSRCQEYRNTTKECDMRQDGRIQQTIEILKRPEIGDRWPTTQMQRVVTFRNKTRTDDKSL